MAATAEVIDQQALLPPAPDILGGKSISELIENGSISVKIDEKYPQAIGIVQILDRLGLWANSAWDFIHNDYGDSPFFTSDFASAIETSSDIRLINRIVPLTPDFAVRICPDFEAKSVRSDMTFPRFRYRRLRPSRGRVVGINRAIVQCAEELLFFRDKAEWVEPFAKKYSGHWIQPIADQIPLSNGQGSMNIFRMRIGLRPQ